MIVARGLTKTYGPKVAVDGLSFTVEPGRVTGFLGPNGAGKTTTLRMLLNLVTPTAGHATISGQRYADLGHPIREVGAVLEASSAHKGRTGINHLRVICAAAGLPRERADEALALVGLTPAAKRKFKGYSLGMRQRLGIASALLGDPQVLVLDEPANGLDPEGIRWLRELLRGHAARGGTVLLSSHLLGEVEHTVDRLVVIGGGRIVADGPIRQLLGADGAVVRGLDTLALSAVLGAAGLEAHTRPDGGLVVPGATTEQVGRIAASHGLVLTDLRPLEQGLEDLFFSLTTTSSDKELVR